MLGGTRLSLGSRFYFKNPEGHDSVGERPPCTQQDCSLTQAEPFLSCRRTYLQALVGCGPCWGGIRRSLGSRFNFNNPGGHGCRTLIVGAPLDTTGLFSNPGWTIPKMLEDSPADPGGVWTLLGVHAAVDCFKNPEGLPCGGKGPPQTHQDCSPTQAGPFL